MTGRSSLKALRLDMQLMNIANSVKYNAQLITMISIRKGSMDRVRRSREDRDLRCQDFCDQ